MRKRLFVSFGILLTIGISSLLLAHGNGDGHDVGDPSGIQYDNISGDSALRRSTCRVYGVDESFLRQGLGYHNDLVIDNGDGIMDRRCYWSFIFMSANTMPITSPVVFRGSPARQESGNTVGVLIDINTDATTPSGYVHFVLDARGVGDCPIRFDAGVKAQIAHLTVLVDNPRKAFCRNDGVTPLYVSLENGHTLDDSQTSTDESFARIDETVTIQPALTFPEMGAGGSAVMGSGGSAGSGGMVGGSGGASGSGTGGIVGSGGSAAGGGGQGEILTNTNAFDSPLRSVSAGGCSI